MDGDCRRDSGERDRLLRGCGAVGGSADELDVGVGNDAACAADGGGGGVDVVLI